MVNAMGGCRLMSKTKELSSDLKMSDRATLDLLVALEGEEQVSQRGLAERLGVALGLTNALLKRAVRKGLVKVSQAPAKRYAYYVTPKGFGEKSRLVAEYLTSSLDFFRVARTQYVDIFNEIVASGRTKVFLYGVGDLAEIAILSAHEAGVEISGIIEPGANRDEFLGITVSPNFDPVHGAEACAVVLTQTEKPQVAYEALAEGVGDALIYSAAFMHVSRRSREDGK